ncbi:MAG: DsbA family protein, partial [Alphaproteobacteria bacterium]
RMIATAGAAGRQDAVVEALFRAYFEDGRDIGDDATLIAVAVDAGLTETAATGALAGDAGDDEVHADNAMAHALGIGGVPCFIVAGRFAIAGAQDPQVFKRLIDSVGAAGLAAE